jgi:hypothetical protein
VEEYLFPPDLTLRFHIDNHSAVDRDELDDLLQFGGTIVDPARVRADIELEITFDDDGGMKLKTSGISHLYNKRISRFAGLRDDPFIRTPRIGRNVAAVVVELPLEAVLGDQDTLLIWATSKVPDVRGPISEYAGRALRSMFIDDLNSLMPSEQWRKLGAVPDVILFDTSLPARFPNGRDLVDDVVDMVVDIPGGTLPGEEPIFPRENDVPFLEEFPYLAPPHRFP